MTFAGIGRPLTDSSALGWGRVAVGRFRDPAQLDEYVGPPAPQLTMVLVTAGHYTIESRDGGALRRVGYAPGSVGITVPGRRNELRWRSAGQDRLESLHLRVAPALVHETLDGLGLPHDDVAGLDVLSLGDAYVAGAMSALGEALDAGAPGLYADSVAEAALVHLAYRRLAGPPRRSNIARDPGVLGRRGLQRVLDYLDAHLGEDVGLDTLAGLVSVSRYHFLRTFTRATGLTPHRYLVEIRLRRAAELLRTSGLSVQQVAASCGYRSPSRFAASFRARYGVSPSEYRRSE
ncbi:helix-turn-helix domain-containing protein [Cryptosporangium phraense]|uniref:Helix-turn-helix transcriptional regulator n=1 Tax=Cryptosporangium phraense TaxID=2593070 RepID=A0A545AXL9_9ACTN|nr:AraC family transcriptional regulator [Cryptosporangium phraense]TQS46048.1 helix-turn-helix transcriptional regulator [Cryptosporangium phraense]